MPPNFFQQVKENLEKTPNFFDQVRRNLLNPEYKPEPKPEPEIEAFAPEKVEPEVEPELIKPELIEPEPIKPESESEIPEPEPPIKMENKFKKILNTYFGKFKDKFSPAKDEALKRFRGKSQ